MSKKLPIELVSNDSLYVSEQKIYPREVQGRFTRLRHTAVWVLLGLYYLVAWLPWDERQAVLWDLPARKFYVFGLVFWPQDFIFLALLLIIAGLALFFFTALAGRMWCGYACPQTVWTEVFVWMERWTEGSRSQQMKLDSAPWNKNKILRKSAKHGLWIGFALWTGFTFVGYFTPIRDLGIRLLELNWGGYETFWCLFYAFATWGNAGFMREQVCKYMCPYARFQSAMFDRNSLIIAYDTERGDPRGARKRGALDSVLNRAPRAASQDDQSDPARLGDCIDCTICVQVCPTGIDIRDGLQYECIACGACVDACDEVMDKMGYPHGLVRYTSENALENRPSKLLRPRVFAYGALLLLLISIFFFGIFTRENLIADVIRDRNALYRIAADSSVENGYSIRLINKSEAAMTVTIDVDPGANPISLLEQLRPVTLAPEEIRNLPITLRADDGTIRGGVDIEFVITQSVEGVQIREPSRFFGPNP